MQIQNYDKFYPRMIVFMMGRWNEEVTNLSFYNYNCGWEGEAFPNKMMINNFLPEKSISLLDLKDIPLQDIYFCNELISNLKDPTLEEWKYLFENRDLDEQVASILSIKDKNLLRSLEKYFFNGNLSTIDSSNILYNFGYSKHFSSNMVDAALAIREDLIVEEFNKIVRAAQLGASEEVFSDFVKRIAAEESRAGILKKIVKHLPKEELPWFLGSESKMVMKSLKRAME